MAKVKNITKDVRSLFSADAPPVQPRDEVTVRDENFVGRAWPTSTWELVEAPELDGYTDQSTDDAILWAEPVEEPDPEPESKPLDVQGKKLTSMTKAELQEIVAAAGIETDATTKADLIAVIRAASPEGN